MELEVVVQLSNSLADLAASGAASVVRVDGRRRGPSSGVIWSADGILVAAHHALERDEDLQVGLPAGETVAASVIGRDPMTDVAVLRVSATGLSTPEWADEATVRPGQLVLAISGSGRSPRVALASVARAGGEFRTAAGGRLDRYVELTADLRPGLSGALVLGANGRALGIATTGVVRSAAIALPPSTLQRVVGALLTDGEVRRGYLGLATIPVPLPPEVRAATGEHVALLVSRVEPDSPAARAGILLGDALLSFGNETLQDTAELLTLLAGDRVGDTVAMKLLRAGEVRDIEVTIGARPTRVRR
jgi:S1-C subfamily serine protease